MGRREYDQPCSFACALDRIGERWSLLIVRELALGPLRFADLDRNVGGAPTDVLSKRLRDLEKHGIVRRRELELPAKGVAYELTDIGRELERPMLELGRWGLHFQPIGEIGEVSPAWLPNAIRIIAQPPPEVRRTIGLRSGGQAHSLRIEDGWITAARGKAVDPDLVLEGEPPAVLAALVLGEAAEDGIEITGDRRALEELRAMIALPERLREAASDLIADREPAAA